MDLNQAGRIYDAHRRTYDYFHREYCYCAVHLVSLLAYLNFKELVYYMRTNPRDPSLQGIIRPVYFVEPGALVSDILKVFVDQHEHIAVVRDYLKRKTTKTALELPPPLM